MNSQQRSRWRTLAEAELARGNLLAPVVLDCLDELDAWAEVNVPPADIRSQETSPWVQPFAEKRGNDPETFPAPAPSVDARGLRHDLDLGPQDEEIEMNLGPEPELGDHNRPFFRP